MKIPAFLALSIAVQPAAPDTTWNYTTDSLAVLTIIDSSGIPARPQYVYDQDGNQYPFSVERISHKVDGRIKWLNISGLLFSSPADPPHTWLRGEIGHITELETLFVEGNFFGSLPPELFSLVKLRYLIASGDRLPSMPPELLNLRRLVGLKWAMNGLAELPEGILTLDSLTYIDLYGNVLTTLPPSIALHDRLTTDVCYNLLCNLPSEVASWLDSHSYGPWRGTQQGCTNVHEKRGTERMALVPGRYSTLFDIRGRSMAVVEMRGLPSALRSLPAGAYAVKVQGQAKGVRRVVVAPER